MIDRRGGYYNFEVRSEFSESGRKTSRNVCYFMCAIYRGAWLLYLLKLRQRRSSYFTLALNKKFIRWKQVKFFILSGNLFLRESAFHIVNCLKSLDFKLLFVYTLKFLRGPCGTFSHNFCVILKTYDLVQSLW